jgi:hypothetical protein
MSTTRVPAFTIPDDLLEDARQLVVNRCMEVGVEISERADGEWPHQLVWLTRMFRLSARLAEPGYPQDPEFTRMYAELDASELWVLDAVGQAEMEYAGFHRDDEENSPEQYAYYESRAAIARRVCAALTEPLRALQDAEED